MLLARRHSIVAGGGAGNTLNIDSLSAAVVSGSTINTFYVQALDGQGQVDTGYVGNATVSALTGTIDGTLTKPFVNGVATFDDISIVATGIVTIQANSGSLDPATDTIDVWASTVLGYQFNQNEIVKTTNNEAVISAQQALVDGFEIEFGFIMTSSTINFRIIDHRVGGNVNRYFLWCNTVGYINFNIYDNTGSIYSKQQIDVFQATLGQYHRVSLIFGDVTDQASVNNYAMVDGVRYELLVTTPSVDGALFKSNWLPPQLTEDYGSARETTIGEYSTNVPLSAGFLDYFKSRTYGDNDWFIDFQMNETTGTTVINNGTGSNGILTGDIHESVEIGFSPIQLSPVVWLDYNDPTSLQYSSPSKISRWKDNSGNANDAYDGSTTAHPLDDGTGVKFVDRYDHLSIHGTDILNGAENYELVMVTYGAEAVGRGMIVFDSNAIDYRYSTLTSAGGNTDMFLVDPFSVDRAKITFTEINKTDLKRRIYEDDYDMQETALNVNLDHTLSDIYLSDHPAIANYGCSGKFREIVLIPSALSITQRQVFKRYLKNKWNIS